MALVNNCEIYISVENFKEIKLDYAIFLLFISLPIRFNSLDV